MNQPFRSWLQEVTTPGKLSSQAQRPMLSEALASRLRQAPGDWGFPEGREAVERLLDPESRVVITGQQPGPWGGPAYTLYKVATAIAVAERLGKSTGHPTVPVYWMGSDDVDHDEVGWGVLPRPDLSLYRHRFPPPGDSRSWIGDTRYPFPGEATEILQSWNGSAVPPADSLEVGHTQARWLLGLLASKGLVVVDARWPELRH